MSSFLIKKVLCSSQQNKVKMWLCLPKVLRSSAKSVMKMFNSTVWRLGLSKEALKGDNVFAYQKYYAPEECKCSSIHKHCLQQFCRAHLNLKKCILCCLLGFDAWILVALSWRTCTRAQVWHSNNHRQHCLKSNFFPKTKSSVIFYWHLCDRSQIKSDCD